MMIVCSRESSRYILPKSRAFGLDAIEMVSMKPVTGIVSNLPHIVSVKLNSSFHLPFGAFLGIYETLMIVSVIGRILMNGSLNENIDVAFFILMIALSRPKFCMRIAIVESFAHDSCMPRSNIFGEMEISGALYVPTIEIT